MLSSRGVSAGDNSYKGFTLLETLISLMLLSILLLGLDAMNLSSLRFAKAIGYFQLAELQVENMKEQQRAGQGKVSAQQMAEWNMQNNSLLPQGRGEISGVRRMAVFWGGKNLLTCEKNIIATTGCITASPSLKF
jgi:prepilin-type N-terminal cleavage/methylation domain-containing protein